MKWADLNEDVKTILERVDICQCGAAIKIGSEVDIPYFKGIFTETMAKEILDYQHSEENKGFFSASLDSEVLKIKFLKVGF
jgi:hypothetical protein